MCKLLSVSDKHLEFLANWGRGTVRNFKVDNENLNWLGFKWEQM